MAAFTYVGVPGVVDYNVLMNQRHVTGGRYMKASIVT